MKAVGRGPKQGEVALAENQNSYNIYKNTINFNQVKELLKQQNGAVKPLRDTRDSDLEKIADEKDSHMCKSSRSIESSSGMNRYFQNQLIKQKRMASSKDCCSKSQTHISSTSHQASQKAKGTASSHSQNTCASNNAVSQRDKDCAP